MGATLQLPEALADRLLSLASEEGVTVDGLVRLLVSEHLERRKGPSGHDPLSRKRLNFPLIPKQETGVIAPVTGTDLDEMQTRGRTQDSGDTSAEEERKRRAARAADRIRELRQGVTLNRPAGTSLREFAHTGHKY